VWRCCICATLARREWLAIRRDLRRAGHARTLRRQGVARTGVALSIRFGLLSGTVVLGVVAAWLARTTRQMPAPCSGRSRLGYGAVAVAARTNPVPATVAAGSRSGRLGAADRRGPSAPCFSRPRCSAAGSPQSPPQWWSRNRGPRGVGHRLIGDSVRHGSAPADRRRLLLSLAGTPTLAVRDVPEEVWRPRAFSCRRL